MTASFRFIVSPDDAGELGKLAELYREHEPGSGPRQPLDWIAIDHWTPNTRMSRLVRGRADGWQRNLVISRDYISVGLRARAGDLVTVSSVRDQSSRRANASKGK